MIQTPWRVVAFSILLVVAVGSLAADGKAIYATCSACHGVAAEGNAKIGAPNIGGMDVWYIERQLANFSSGVRGAGAADSFGAQMRAAVSAIKSDAERTAVAAYVAALPAKKVTGAAKADMANGSTQFNAICSSCHGSHGKGNKMLGAPSLVGIDPGYLERQIIAFRSGTRGSHKDDKWGAQMRVGAGMLPDTKSVRDVLAHVGTLKN